MSGGFYAPTYFGKPYFGASYFGAGPDEQPSIVADQQPDRSGIEGSFVADYRYKRKLSVVEKRYLRQLGMKMVDAQWRDRSAFLRMMRKAKQAQDSP